VKRVGNDDILYNLVPVFAVPVMKDSKTARTLSDIFSSFKLKESVSSEYILRVVNENQPESVTDENQQDNTTADHAGINIDYKSDDCKLSIAMIAVLIDLKVIKAKQTKQITRTISTKKKLYDRFQICLLNTLFSYRFQMCLLNILFIVLFVLTCFLNLPFFAIHAPLTWGVFSIYMECKGTKVFMCLQNYLVVCAIGTCSIMFRTNMFIVIGIYAICGQYYYTIFFK
jgi:hypothetical protein